MTQFTPEEIEKRKADSAAKRAEGKRIAKEIRAKDKEIAQKMHENRRNILYTCPIPYVTLATTRQEDGSVFVFWTVKHQRDRDSFKLAKKWLGRYMEESVRGHYFMLDIPHPVDAYTLEYLVNWNFMLKVISGEVRVPPRIRKEIKQKLARENY